MPVHILEELLLDLIVIHFSGVRLNELADELQRELLPYDAPLFYETKVGGVFGPPVPHAKKVTLSTLRQLGPP